ncbi:MAG: hypothetical protein V3U02_12910 [Calditrichia bacterium]
MSNKLYKYVYKGTSGISVLNQEAHRPGDVITIPVKNFRHRNFVPMDGQIGYPKPIMDLKDKFKNKWVLLIGRGESCNKTDYKLYKNYIKIAVNPSEEILKKAKPEYVIYLENNYAQFINRNLKSFKGIVIIGNQLALDCEYVNYCYGDDSVIPGHSSGFYALQIAQIMGFKKIYLTGYDYTGKEYPLKTFTLWVNDFKAIKNKKNIYNLNKDSRLQFEEVVKK